MKISAIINGIQTLVPGLTASRGSEDAGKPIFTNSEGKADVTLFPDGIGADNVVRPATEAISANSPVNFYNNDGVASIRNADATSKDKPAHGFVKASVASGANGTVYATGFIHGLSGLTPGQRMYLGTTPGTLSATPLDPDDSSNSGRIHQVVAAAVSADTVLFRPDDFYVIA